MSLDIPKDSKLKSSINLVVIQLGQYLIPLISSPYVIHVVGLEKYGKYAFFQAIMGLLSVFVSYGFVQSGVRDISRATTIKNLNGEFSNIFYAKLFGLIVAVILGLALLLMNRFWFERELFLLSFLALFLFFLDISYVYQGIERLKDYAYLNFFGSVFVVALLFLLIRDSSDYVFLPIVFFAPRIVVTIVSYYLLFLRFKIIPAQFEAEAIYGKIKSNFHFFLSNVSILLYSRTTAVMLGIVVSESAVGAFSLADQLFSAYNNIQGKISAVYHPQVVRGFAESKLKGALVARECIFVMLLLSISGFVFTQFFAYEILFALFKNAADQAHLALRILSLNFIFIQLSSILGIQIFLTLRGDRDILRISFYAAIFNLIFSFILTYYFQVIGAALSVAIVEFIILIYYMTKVAGMNIQLLDRRMLADIFRFSVSIVFVATVLKLLSNSMPLNHLLKLLVAIAIYLLSIPLIQHRMGIVDLKQRKLLFC